MAINFSNDNIVFDLKQKTKLKQWIVDVIKKEKLNVGQLNYTFMSDDALLKINIEYLKHNTYTDIITFDYCEEKNVSGDVFISVDRIKENAKKFGVSFEEELHRVMIHGVLHLCGYKDKSKTDSELMRKKENSALRILKSPKKG
jgi:rRNA maturation RNase YbeY